MASRGRTSTGNCSTGFTDRTGGDGDTSSLFLFDLCEESLVRELAAFDGFLSGALFVSSAIETLLNLLSLLGDPGGAFFPFFGVVVSLHLGVQVSDCLGQGGHGWVRRWRTRS